MLCSIDGLPCCDDLCYGGGCIRGGEEMHECATCGKLYSEWVDCDCDPGDDCDREWLQDDEIQCAADQPPAPATEGKP